jgi:hypothetical protein
LQQQTPLLTLNKKSDSTGWRLSQFLDAISEPQVVLPMFLTTGYILDFLQSPLWVQLIYLNISQNSGKHVLFAGLLQRMLQKIQWKDAQDKVWVEELGAPGHPPGTSVCSASYSEGLNSVLWVFLET